MQLSTAIPKLGAVSYAELRLAMRAALVEQRVWNVVRDGILGMRCSSMQSSIVECSCACIRMQAVV
jgi:hypothetical protein